MNTEFISNDVCLVYETVMQQHIFLLALSVNPGEMYWFKNIHRIKYIMFIIEIKS